MGEALQIARRCRLISIIHRWGRLCKLRLNNAITRGRLIFIFHCVELEVSEEVSLSQKWLRTNIEGSEYFTLKNSHSGLFLTASNQDSTVISSKPFLVL